MLTIVIVLVKYSGSIYEETANAVHFICYLCYCCTYVGSYGSKNCLRKKKEKKVMVVKWQLPRFVYKMFIWILQSCYYQDIVWRFEFVNTLVLVNSEYHLWYYIWCGFILYNLVHVIKLNCHLYNMIQTCIKLRINYTNNPRLSWSLQHGFPINRPTFKIERFPNRMVSLTAFPVSPVSALPWQWCYQCHAWL